MRERLVAVDALGRSYAYDLPAESIPPLLRSYRSTIRVRPVTTTEATFVEWFCDFDCESGVDEKLRRSLARDYARLLDGLAAHVPASSTRPGPRREAEL